MIEPAPESLHHSEPASLRKPRVRQRRRNPYRGIVLSQKRLKPIVRAIQRLEEPLANFPPRPRTRGDCVNGPRPCPWASCRHHLYLEVSPETGAIRLNFPNLELEQLEHTCALDIADRGTMTLDVVGDLINVTRERARQIEVRALLRLKANIIERGDDLQ